MESAEDTVAARGTSMATMAAGDDWPDLLVRNQIYIPDNYLRFVGYSGDPNLPTVAFGGDSHGKNVPNASFRMLQDIRFSFGSDHKNPVYTPATGTTRKYKCTILLSGCVQTATAKAPTTNMNASNLSHGATSGGAVLNADVADPLVPGAPGITTLMGITIRSAGSSVYGQHDAMPKHEVFIGIPNSEWHSVYDSAYFTQLQLPCLLNYYGYAAACTQHFNAQI